MTALRPNSLQWDGDSNAIQRWVATVPADTLLDDVLKPDFWVHDAKKVYPGASILVMPEGGDWEAELRVRSAGPRHLAVGLLYHKVWAEVAEERDADTLFAVNWGGPAQKYRIIRKSDSTVVEANFVTKADAYARLPALMQAA